MREELPLVLREHSQEIELGRRQRQRGARDGDGALVEIDPKVADLHSENVESLCSDVNLIVDATDNVETRYLSTTLL